MTNTRKPALAMLSSVAFLAACSGEPSESDIRSALEADIEGMNQAVETLGGDLARKKGLKMVLHEVEKVGCEKDAGGYRCDVVTDVETPFLGRRKNTATIRLVETKEGWRISQ